MISHSSTELFYPDRTDPQIEESISALPDHLKAIFEGKVMEGLSRRHAFFIASSYDWRERDGK